MKKLLILSSLIAGALGAASAQAGRDVGTMYLQEQANKAAAANRDNTSLRGIDHGPRPDTHALARGHLKKMPEGVAGRKGDALRGEGEKAPE